jgi:hypothetical protein
MGEAYFSSKTYLTGKGPGPIKVNTKSKPSLKISTKIIKHLATKLNEIKNRKSVQDRQFPALSAITDANC